MAENQPDYVGHRSRIEKKFLTYGADIFADYEFLELILMCALPRIDVKPLAKQLLAEFGSLSAVLTASPKDLMKIKGIKNHTVLFLKVILVVSRSQDTWVNRSRSRRTACAGGGRWCIMCAMEKTRPILYGVADYALLRQKDGWFIDRTAKIRFLESARHAVP